MRDLALWEHLIERRRSGRSPLDPVARGLLEELVDEPIAARIPYLTFLVDLVEDPDATVREIALAALRGAVGIRALRAITQSLGDDNAPVRRVATEALRESASHQPSRYAHAVFHARSDVRRSALELAKSLSTRWYGTLLVADPENRDLAIETLRHTAPLIPATLDFVRDGLVDAELARERIAEIHPTQAFESIDQQRCHELWRLFWTHGEEPSEVQTRFFREHQNYCARHHSLEFQIAMGSAIFGVARETGTWCPLAMKVALASDIGFIEWEAPHDVLRAALAAVYEERHTHSHYKNSAIRKFLSLPICRRNKPDGELDLWVVGAILHFAEKKPYRLAVDVFGIDEILAGFLASPEEAASFFSIPDQSRNGRREILKELHKAAGKRVHDALAILTLVVHADELEFLDSITKPQLSSYLEALFDLERRPETNLREGKARAVARRLVPKLLQRFDDVLRLWLNACAVHPPWESHLGMQLFTLLAIELDAETASKRITKLPQQQLHALLHAIPHCNAFPYSTEVALAIALATHRDREIREWAEVRQPRSVAAAPVTKEEPALQLSSSVLKEIATCPEPKLTATIEAHALRPNQGLSEALAKRTAMSNATVCVALLACFDDFDLVVEQFVRFWDPTEDFAKDVDTLAVSELQRKNLPLIGDTWLCLWEHHTFRGLEQLTQWSNGISGALEAALSFPLDVLTTNFYRTVERAFSKWRFRDWSTLQAHANVDVIEALVHALTDERVDVLAAGTLQRLYLSGAARGLLDRVHADVEQLLPDLTAETRTALQPWVKSTNLGAPGRRTAQVSSAEEERLLARVRTTSSVEELSVFCRTASEKAVSEAALRLIEFGAEAELAQLLEEAIAGTPYPHARTIAQSIPLWGESAGNLFAESPASGQPPTEDAPTPIQRTLALVDAEFGDAEIRFKVGLGLLERCSAQGREISLLSPETEDADGSSANTQAVAISTLASSTAAAVLAPTEAPWFRAEDWQALIDLGIDNRDLALQLAPSPQPHAYMRAVRLLLDGVSRDRVAGTFAATQEALVAFLHGGSDRLENLRVETAEILQRNADYTGFPILLRHLLTDKDSTPSTRWMNPLIGAPPSMIDAGIESGLLAGVSHVYETTLLRLLDEVESEFSRSSYQRMVEEATMEYSAAVTRLRRTAKGRRRIRRLAQTFAWGVKRGRELTSRMFRVIPTSGEDLGYTRLNESKVYVTPLPILREEQGGREVVEALILHELGHHMYHRGSEAEAVWRRAEKKEMHGLLNLVSDEHLERRLRALDVTYGNRLKRLAAYGFQHAQKDVDVETLLNSLQTHAFPVLSKVPLGVARRQGAVHVESGALHNELERVGQSFTRFVRALRMGLGNRHNDPKVAEALKLFGRSFKKSSMEQLWQITLELQRIFGDETKAIDSLAQDKLLEGDPEGLMIFGEGLSNEELQQQVDELLTDKGKLETSSASKGGGGMIALNVGVSEEFTPILDIEPVRYDPVAAAPYIQDVARYARTMREFLERLGLSYRRQHRRISGHTVDRARVHRAVIHSDPRILISRTLETTSDLFLGLVIDCSGSMELGDNIEKAKRFAYVLSEAAHRLAGIDVRVFGFTDSKIYDAGEASRCAAHALEAEGGNNDAAALWHAAQVAMRSRRSARLLVMISDGLPTECTVVALQKLVKRLTRRQIVCAQVAVRPLETICFPHYVELDNELSMGHATRRFGEIIVGLVRGVLSA